MTEGQGATAAAARDPGAGVSAGPVADARPVPAEAVPPRPSSAAPSPVPRSPIVSSPAQAPAPEAPAESPSPAAESPSPAAGAPPPRGAAEGQGRAPGQEPAGEAEIEPHVRVDARLIESAILALRKPIVAASLPLEAPGVAQARQERHKLLSQIDD